MSTHSQLLEYAGTPVEDLPPALQEQLKANPRLAREFESQAEVAALLKLKTYEHPDSAMFGRVRHRVSIRLNQGISLAPEPFFGPLPGWARMVAVVVVMLGLSVLTHREMLRSPGSEDLPVATAIGSQPAPSMLLPEEKLWAPDPFTTVVLGPQLAESEGLSVTLTEQLEADFESLGLGPTNRVDEMSLLPVRLPAGP